MRQNIATVIPGARFLLISLLLMVLLLPLPAMASVTPQISAGASHTVELKSDGTVWTWGLNTSGQLGNSANTGTSNPNPTPAQVSGLINVIAIAAGEDHSLALTSNGTVLAWGNNYNGQLGNSNFSSQSIPTEVSGLTDVIAIAAGAKFSLALKSNGTVSAWGTNSTGQLGNANYTSQNLLSPVSGLTNVIAIAAGKDHALALTSGGKVLAWGYNFYGQVGNSTNYYTNPTPAEVSGLSNVIAIAAGGSHSLALKSDGNVWSWGSNYYQQLGRSASYYNPNPTPAQVSQFGVTNIIAIAAGTNHTIALKSDGTVWAWGSNSRGQLGRTDSAGAVSGPANVITIAAGAEHSVALKNDGAVWSWGFNDYGQLGYSTTLSGDTPALAQITNSNNPIAVAAGAHHSLALAGNGTALSWGLNSQGQLGDNSTTQSSSPVLVKGVGGGGVLSDIIAIAPGDAHTLALKSNGTVFGWGCNAHGRLGNNSAADSSSPVQVVGSSGSGYLSNVTAVAAGGGHSVALLSNGTVWAWGYNEFGQIGNGATSSGNNLLPVQVLTAPGVPLANVIAIATGWSHTIALKSDGTVWAWGYNNYGQLGYNGTTNSSYAAQVSSLGDVVAITARMSHTVALKSDGTVWAWGYNEFGQLGKSASTSPNPTPAQVSGVTDVIAIAAGSSHTLVLKSDGKVWAFGNNSQGQLGNSTNSWTSNPNPTPAQVYGPDGSSYLTDVSALAVGYNHNIALKSDGTIWTWGGGDSGQLGNGATSPQVFPLEPTLLLNLSATVSGNGYLRTIRPNEFSCSSGTCSREFPKNSVVQLIPQAAYGSYFGGWSGCDSVSGNVCSVTMSTGKSVSVTFTARQGDYIAMAGGGNHSAAIENNGMVAAWGENYYGQLGSSTNNTTYNPNPYPATVSGPTNVIATAAGESHTVALKSDGKVLAWGYNAYGQLGKSANTSANPTPAEVSGLSNVIAVAVGKHHTVALNSDGIVWTWGLNDKGQLGSLTNSGTNSPNPTPAKVSGLSNVIAIAAGGSHTLALKSDGTVWSWGLNDKGQLGNTTNSGTSNPTPYLFQVSGLTDVIAIAGGGSHSLALKSDGTVWAWGYNEQGQLGKSVNTSPNPTPAQVSGPANVIDIAAGTNHTIALKSDGTVLAWGYNNTGQLGNGNFTSQNIPVAVSSLTSVIAIAAGGSHTLALKSDGTLLAWGKGASGQLGNGNTSSQTSPVQTKSLISFSATVSGNGSIRTVASNDFSCSSGTCGRDFIKDLVIELVPQAASGSYFSGWSGCDSVSGSVCTVTMSAAKSVSATFTALAGDYIAVAGGETHTVGLSSDGTVSAWGYNEFGQLGNSTYSGTINPNPTPAPVSGLTNMIAVAAGRYHTVALKSDGIVWAWGYNGAGQLGTSANTSPNPTPAQVSGPTNVIAIAAGNSHTVALKGDGTVLAWGGNTSGQLGNGNFTSQSTPAAVSGLTNVIAIAAGSYHTVALKGDGSVWAWGYNNSGQLGNGNFASQNIPVAVSSLTNVIAIAAGGSHTLALKSDGTVWAWGMNDKGQLGNSNFTSQNLPAAVSGPASVIAVAAGGSHTLAIKSDGTVLAWGYNEFGQLGKSANTSPNPTPDTVSGLTSIFAIASGEMHSLAIRIDGIVYAWGKGTGGQLGNGSTSSQTSPVQAKPLLSFSATISGNGLVRTVASTEFTCSSGTCGRDFAKDLVVELVPQAASGNYFSGWSGCDSVSGTVCTVTMSAAKSVTATFTTFQGVFIAVAAGRYHTVALKSDGTVWAWGSNNNGQLGNSTRIGTEASNSVPAQVPGLTNVIAIAAHGNFDGTQNHTLALKSDGTVWAWGSNLKGQLGNSTNSGTFRPNPVPIQVSGLTNVIAIAAGGTHSLALTSDGTVWAWGYNEFGQLGKSANIIPNPTPGTVSGLTNVIAITAGEHHSLALKSNGTVLAWGSNSKGQLGRSDNFGNFPDPSTVSGLANIIAIAAGKDHSLALKSDGTVLAWGSNSNGQLGRSDNFGNIPAPATVSGLTNVTAIAAGYFHTLALRNDGKVWAWGENGNGQLGRSDNFMIVPTPAEVSGLTNVTAIAADGWHTLALKSDGAVWAWGSNYKGQLGYSANSNRNPTPTQVSNELSNVIAIAAGYSHTVVLYNDGTVWAWGRNSVGQLGNGNFSDQNTPAAVSGLTNVIAIAAGDDHTVALKSDGTVLAWGYNNKGQLGNSNLTPQNLPAAVSGPTNVIAIAAGGSHTLALKSDGTVLAWGSNSYGQLGKSVNTSPNPTPDTVSELSNIIAIASGYYHSLALKIDGNVYAWGNNTVGQLGRSDNYGSNPTPTTVSGLPTNVTAIAVGDGHSLALSGGGTVWAWGYNAYGQLRKSANIDPNPTPAAVDKANGMDEAIAIAAGSNHTLALNSDGTVFTWGRNLSGQLGFTANNDANIVPMPVSNLTNVIAIASRGDHSVALRRNGSVFSFGDNSFGQLGNGTSGGNSATPVTIKSLAMADSNSFMSLTGAYAFASHGNTIKALVMNYAETLNANRPISVTLQGGYTSSAFSTRGSGISSLQGVTITSGTVTFDGMTIK
jgi:alpha-tubulin suppressor-like RCC1 family protein